MITEEDVRSRLSANASDFDEVISDALQLIVELKAKLALHQWVSVETELPKKSGMYQVVTEINCFPSTREYCHKSLMWISRDTITHWKPITLPKGTK